MIEPARATLEDAFANGRELAHNPECVAAHVAPFVLATRCEGAVLDLAIRRVSAFALVLSSILVGVIVARAAPLPLLAIPAVWGSSALAALFWVVRRRRRLGVFLVDFESERIVQWPPHGAARREYGWTNEAELRIGDAPHEEALRWIEFVVARPHVGLRIARVDARGAAAIARLFRTYRVACVDAQRADPRDSNG